MSIMYSVDIKIWNENFYSASCPTKSLAITTISIVFYFIFVGGTPLNSRVLLLKNNHEGSDSFCPFSLVMYAKYVKISPTSGSLNESLSIVNFIDWFILSFFI